MPLFSKKSAKEKRKEIGRKVASELKERKRIKGLARGFEKLERERKENARLKKIIREQRTASKLSRGISGGLRSFARVRQNQLRFARDVNRGALGRDRKTRILTRAGRPGGSYDPRYAPYGGVYGYRKTLNAQLRQQRLQQLRDAQLSPEQQALLARDQARRRAAFINPENRVIPDTDGKTYLPGINQEIDDAANLVP